MLRTVMHRLITGSIVLLIGLFAGLAIVVLGAPLVGHEAVIVRGGSMAPTLPFGSLVLVNHRDLEVLPGDIVTVRRESGVLVTHRVVEVVDGETPTLVLKGDANEQPDARPVLASSVVGTVTYHLPVAGFLAFLLRQPSGLLSLGTLLACLLLAARLLEDDADEAPADDPGRSGPSLPTAISAGILSLCLMTAGTGGPLTSSATFGHSPTTDATLSTAASW
jgi:signal peptidase I